MRFWINHDVGTTGKDIQSLNPSQTQPVCAAYRLSIFIVLLHPLHLMVNSDRLRLWDTDFLQVNVLLSPTFLLWHTQQQTNTHMHANLTKVHIQICGLCISSLPQGPMSLRYWLHCQRNIAMHSSQSLKEYSWLFFLYGALKVCDWQTLNVWDDFFSWPNRTWRVTKTSPLQTWTHTCKHQRAFIHRQGYAALLICLSLRNVHGCSSKGMMYATPAYATPQHSSEREAQATRITYVYEPVWQHCTTHSHYIHRVTRMCMWVSRGILSVTCQTDTLYQSLLQNISPSIDLML